MSLDVIDFEFQPCKTKIACVHVKYYDLVLKCDLVYYVKQKKVWLRMPEKWITKEKKVHFCFWPLKQISDDFQKEVLKKIFDKYDLDIGKIAKFHRDECEKRSLKRIL